MPRHGPGAKISAFSIYKTTLEERGKTRNKFSLVTSGVSYPAMQRRTPQYVSPQLYCGEYLISRICGRLIKYSVAVTKFHENAEVSGTDKTGNVGIRIT